MADTAGSEEAVRGSGSMTGQVMEILRESGMVLGDYLDTEHAEVLAAAIAPRIGKMIGDAQASEFKVGWEAGWAVGYREARDDL